MRSRPLVVGIALALVCATALWWSVDRRREPLVPEASATLTSAAPREAELQAADAAERPVDAGARTPASADEPGSARAAVDAGARTIRGRLLDGHCGPPITSGVRLELSSRIGAIAEVVEPGPDGSFATTRAFAPGRVVIRVLEARSGEELFEKALTFDPGEPVWTVWAHLGLVIPLELGVPAEMARQARVHVVEEGPDGPSSWIDMPLRGGDHPFVHYRALIQHREDATAARLEVEIESPRGPKLQGGAVLAKTHGVHPMLTVGLAEETHAFGRVVDESGQSVAAARVWLLPTAPAEPVDEEAIRDQIAGEDGAFWIGDLEPGLHALRASLDNRSADLRRVLLREGANDLGTIVVPSAGPGEIHGSLTSVWNWKSSVLVSITDLATGRRSLTVARPGDEAARLEFEAHNVPEGTYEVRPLPEARVHFEPASRIVSPTVFGVEFRAVPSDAGKLVIRVLDGRSREPLERFSVGCRIDGGWAEAGMSPNASLPYDAERYVILARGYRAEIVSAADLRATSDAGVRQAEVPLLQGWCAVFVFVDAEDDGALVDGEFWPWLAEPVADARVRADGQTVATSDGDGLALVVLDEEPRELRFELAGRSAIAAGTGEGLRFVWMIRE